MGVQRGSSNQERIIEDDFTCTDHESDREIDPGEDGVPMAPSQPKDHADATLLPEATESAAQATDDAVCVHGKHVLARLLS